MTAEVSTKGIQKIGRYRVTGELGRGGMGIVYRGEDRLIGRRVAIKTLTEVTPELRERFQIEARSGILSHQNIVTVYEVGEHEGSPFIAMEFIEGDSLEKVLRLRKRLPLLEALSIVEQVCAGLGYAHGHGVVHRDVKPANILVRPDGRVTIVDFAALRAIGVPSPPTSPPTLPASAPTSPASAPTSAPVAAASPPTSAAVAPAVAAAPAAASATASPRATAASTIAGMNGIVVLRDFFLRA